MQKKRIAYVSIGMLVLMMLLALTACGGKSQESVNKKIEKQLTSLEGYKAEAEMTMNTGKAERKYTIDIWFQKKEGEDFYRVDLQNESDDHHQTILKNDEGVFVLTPLLNKSFKFQSDWPENNGQPYLYQSLIQDIIEDKEVSFTEEEEYYKYTTKTNYMNSKHLPYQHVYFDKKTYLPMYVQVLGEDDEPLIEVKFTQFDTNPSFAEADFDREAILGEAPEEEKETAAMSEQVASKELLVPVVTLGAELTETENIAIEDGNRTIMTFKGDRDFTLIQERMEAIPAQADVEEELKGELVHLGHSIAALSDGMISWNYKGTQYYLASKELTVDELITVASSVYGRTAK